MTSKRITPQKDVEKIIPQKDEVPQKIEVKKTTPKKVEIPKRNEVLEFKAFLHNKIAALEKSDAHKKFATGPGNSHVVLYQSLVTLLADVVRIFGK